MKKSDTINKILMTGDTIGGVWTYTLELVQSLQPYNIEIHLATMGARLNRAQKLAARQLNNLTIHESDYALEWMNNPWDGVEKAGAWLLQLEQEIQPEIIHLNGYTHASLDFEAPVVIVGHSDVISWWQQVKKENAPAQYDAYYQRVKDGLLAADMVIGVSKTMLRFLHDIYGPLENTAVIYNARTATGFNPAKKEEQVFGMGRLWDEAKNAEALKDIAPALSWPVFVAGEDYGLMKSQPRNFHYTGLLSPAEISHWLGISSIYVLPAKYEPFGLSALEAAFSGCALVLGDIESLREIWGDAAVYVNPDDHNALKNIIEELINNPEKRSMLGDKARAHARKYNTIIMAQQYMTAYKTLLTHHRQTKLDYSSI